VKKIMTISFFSVAVLMLALPVLALEQAPDTVNTIDDVVGVIETAVNWLFTLILSIAVIMLLWAAFLWMTSSGDETKVGDARKTLIYALVGVAIAIVAKGLVTIVQQLLS